MRSRRFLATLAIVPLVTIGLLGISVPAHAGGNSLKGPDTVFVDKVAKFKGKLKTKVVRKAFLQTKVGSKWKTVKKTKTNKKGKFKLKWRAPSTKGTFKFRVLAPKTKVKGKKYRKLVTKARKLQVARPGPGQDVFGPGITKISETVTGADEQWGRVSGFLAGRTIHGKFAGASTWLLSTGKIEDAVGVPSTFANSAMGQPGDAALTSLVGGLQTFDAAIYEAKIKPSGDMLHVRYIFASEEYPEFVGSSYNDVMAVFVNGVNCALVGGSAVAVNTINAGSNPSLYIDNSTGAAGYATTMDGLTVPLTCNVPVTPGSTVTVRVGVADTSDQIYDTAVALLDKGIWSD